MQAYTMKYWQYAFNTLDLILGKNKCSFVKLHHYKKGAERN